MKKKRIVCLLICALMLISCFSFSACGASDPEAANYEVEKGVITKYVGPGGDITIPAKIGGKKITAIGERAFYANDNVKSVTISDGIKEIGKEAFYYSHVETVNLGTVEKIDEAAFRLAPLMNVTLPGTVKELGYQCFASLSRADNTNGTLYIPASVTNIPEEAFYFTRFQTIEFESATLPTMAANSFENSGIASVILPDSVVADDILDYTDKLLAAGMNEASLTFANTKGEPLVFEYEDFSDRFRYSLANGELIEYLGSDETIVLPTSIEGVPMTVVGSGLFKDNTTLNKVIIPQGYVTIVGAFAGCTNLETVVLPESMKTIGNSAFAECSKLESIVIPESVTEIGDGAFAECSALKNIDLPESVTSIGIGTFSQCTALESITLSPNMTEIPESAFWHCDSLNSITLPDSVKKLGKSAFESTGLTSIDLNKVETMDEYALSCTKLTEVTVPGTVKVIPPSCFHFCQFLKDITLEEGVERISECAFALCGRDESKKVTRNFIDALGPDEFPDITILPNQEDYQNFITIHMPSTIKYIGSDFVQNCYVNAIYMLSVKSAAEMPEFAPDAFKTVFYVGQVFFEKEVIDERMDEMDAFLMSLENMKDRAWYDDGRIAYWCE